MSKSRTKIFALSSAVVFSILSLAAQAFGATINNSNTGLSSPGVIINFGSGSYSDGTIITNQYASQGVTFGTGYQYFDTGCCLPAVSGGFLGANNAPGGIFFATPVTGAAFSWRTPDGTTTFTAWLAGVLVGSFSASTDLAVGTGKYYGFSNLLFDEISLSISADVQAYSLDNLQINAVPLPAALPLLAAGLSAMGLMGWRKKRKAIPS